ncbi:hypothetical protein F3Y22_tig00111783pilonHSYRG00382 [Hibiscus syriacus]|uniref:Uncharacterized protein n=1 Tax=Hibiscus syriacus TaxID=106335 RepID=A0A6A2XCU9_HIBSY|nr:hypothetical protein F3Y22_tig00111783pilonHSYRG00382 [Hibiscus syriacus]
MEWEVQSRHYADKLKGLTDNVRCLSSKINHCPCSNWDPISASLCVLEANHDLTQRIQGCCIRSRHFRLRSNPTNLRLRLQLPDPKVPPIPKHRESECIHLAATLAAHILLTWLAGGVLAWPGVDWCISGAELVMVDSGGTGLFRSMGFSQILCQFGRDAVLGDLDMQILVLVAGLLDNPELALDSLSICMSISTVMLMVSVGFSATARKRKDDGESRLCGWFVLGAERCAAVGNVVCHRP